MLDITYTSTTTVTFPAEVVADVLLIAGGGSGGSSTGTIAISPSVGFLYNLYLYRHFLIIVIINKKGGGGGGAGGIGYGKLFFFKGVPYTFTVGSGGSNSSICGSNGGNSAINGGSISEIAIGGGCGGCAISGDNSTSGFGSDGGSGGGMGYSSLR